MSPTATYRPRHPERTPFYQCLQDYWEEFNWRVTPISMSRVCTLAAGGGKDRRPLLGVRPLAPWFCPSEMWPMFSAGALSVLPQNEMFLSLLPSQAGGPPLWSGSPKKSWNRLIIASTSGPSPRSCARPSGDLYPPATRISGLFANCSVSAVCRGAGPIGARNFIAGL